jgi:hypothetical protein
MKLTIIVAALLTGAIAAPLTVSPEVERELERLNAPEPWEKRSLRAFLSKFAVPIRLY